MLFYSILRFANDIEYMTGKRPSYLWLVCWKYISPVVILIIIVSNLFLLASKEMQYKAYVGCSAVRLFVVIFLFCNKNTNTVKTFKPVFCFVFLHCFHKVYCNLCNLNDFFFFLIWKDIAKWRNFKNLL